VAPMSRWVTPAPLLTSSSARSMSSASSCAVA
jgi:hypothetical protein